MIARHVLLGFYLIAVFLFACGMGDIRGSSEELLTLKEQGKDEAIKEAELVKQERNFQNIRTAIKSGRLEKGEHARQVADLFGEPAVKSPSGRGEQWIYFTRAKKWLKTPRIELYFDAKTALTGWECAYADCVSNPSKSD